MSLDRREEILNEILSQCFGSRPGFRDAEQIAKFSRRRGDVADLTASEVAMEADYLVGRGFLALDPAPLDAASKRWKITSPGIDYLRERGCI
jgi:hypothetical protein